jgi:hypothetical protein
MSLKTIVEALGGDLYERGRRANIPAPGHSAADRSVSLLLENGRVIVHTFGDGDWRSVLEHLRAHRLIDAHNAPRSIVEARRRVAGVAASAPERRDAALRIWEGGRAIDGTAAERYCRRRGAIGDLPGPEVLRFHPEAPVSVYRQSSGQRPALLAAIQAADDALTGIEVTYLTSAGLRAHDLRLSRKTVGRAPGGCAIRLGPAAPEMLAAEGLFSAWSASKRFARPGWPLMSTRNLRAWTPPEAVRSVLIAADRGKDGEASAEVLRGRLVGLGLAAWIELPPWPFADWNEWDCATLAAASALAG